MNDMMTFPDTWEDFERSYGFTDNEEVYTNGARLIPSFRVKQWLDHLLSAQQEQFDCEDCIKNGGDWECDRVHCHKGDSISRTAAIDAIWDGINYDIYTKEVKEILEHLPSIESEPRPISYLDCSNAILKMWMDNVVTDGEYNRIMDKLNKKHEEDMRGDSDDN